MFEMRGFYNRISTKKWHRKNQDYVDSADVVVKVLVLAYAQASCAAANSYDAFSMIVRR